MAAHPRLRLDLDLTDRHFDLATDGIDVAVQVAKRPSSTNVIARKITSVRRLAWASLSYLVRRGRLMQPTDLMHHDTLCFSQMSTGDLRAFHDAASQSIEARLHPTLYAGSNDMLCELAAQGG